jgi:hypothetical protein
MKEEQIKNLIYLLKRLDILRDKISARNEGKEKFNVFSCLYKTTDEVNLHSRFISSLIDPQGSHGLGTEPLKLLLDILGSKFPFNKERMEIYPSYYNKKEYKEIDILLIDRNVKYAVIIENKIKARDSNHEGEGQLERYYRQIIEEDKIPQENVEVYYLTLDGHEPSQESVSTSSKYKDLPDIVQCITYGVEITQWLGLCLQIACTKPYIRETIAQYLNLIKQMVNDTEIEDRLEIIKAISKNDDTLASAKLLFDNYKHIQWHTIFDLFNDFYTELEERGYTIKTKVENQTITDAVHKDKRKLILNFKIKDKYGFIFDIGCNRADFLWFGLKNEDNSKITKENIKSLEALAAENGAGKRETGWIFWKYFDVPENIKIYIGDFGVNATFRIINPITRKETVKQYIDDMESYLYKTLKIEQFIK